MKNDLQFGQEVERLAENEILPVLFPLSRIKRIADDKYWRRHGVDFVLQDDVHKERLFVDIKADKWDSGNAIAEDYTLLHSGRKDLGWLHTSKSDYILYFILPKQAYLVIDLPHLRHLMQHRTFEVKSTANPWGTTYFFLLPVGWLETEFHMEVVPDKTWNTWMSTYVNKGTNG